MKFAGKSREWSATPSQTPHEVFVCSRIGDVRLSRVSCGRRFKHLHSPRIRGEIRATSSACLGCPTGRAHAKGDAPTHWPDGMLIRDTELRPHVALERLLWRGHA